MNTHSFLPEQDKVHGTPDGFCQNNMDLQQHLVKKKKKRIKQENMDQAGIHGFHEEARTSHLTPTFLSVANLKPSKINVSSTYKVDK